jgi:hypothetical protein
VYEWKMRPDGRDNHWLDGLVGCAVAASVLGCSLTSHGGGPGKPRPKLSLAEMQAQAKGRRIGEKPPAR